MWTERAIKDFYLNNILIHELGHLLDDRNSRSVDRERYAEWFAVEYGYKPTRRLFAVPREVVRRHHRPQAAAVEASIEDKFGGDVVEFRYYCPDLLLSWVDSCAFTSRRPVAESVAAAGGHLY